MRFLQLAQSNAILNYVTRLGGMIAANPVDQAISESVMAAIEDFWNSHLQPTMSMAPEEKKVAREAIAAKQLPWMFERFERILKANTTGSGFIAGNTCTAGDLKAENFWWFLSTGNADHIPITCMDTFPAILAHKAKMAVYLAQ